MGPTPLSQPGTVILIPCSFISVPPLPCFLSPCHIRSEFRDGGRTLRYLLIKHQELRRDESNNGDQTAGWAPNISGRKWHLGFFWRKEPMAEIRWLQTTLLSLLSHCQIEVSPIFSWYYCILYQNMSAFNICKSYLFRVLYCASNSGSIPLANYYFHYQLILLFFFIQWIVFSVKWKILTNAH